MEKHNFHFNRFTKNIIMRYYQNVYVNNLFAA